MNIEAIATVKRIISSKPLTIPEARDILERVGESGLGEFQRRVLDYSIKFSKVQGPIAQKLMKSLVEKHGLDEFAAAQVVNCMPESVEELRTILAIKGKVFSTEQLDAILKTLKAGI